jgi:hypothetical protein
MFISRLRMLLASLALLVAMSFCLAPTAAFAASQVSPKGRICTAGWVYGYLSNQGTQLFQVGPTYRDYNGTSSTATVKLTAAVSGSISLILNPSAGIEASVVFGSVKASINYSIQWTLTASQGNEIDISVPAHKAGYGAYGVITQKVLGDYYYRGSNCSKSGDTWVTSYSPWYVGWITWIGN